MPAWLNQDLTTLAFCWRLARRDGVTLGFTSHDRDLEIDGLVYRAAPGMVPSAIETTAGFDADAVELAGALTSDAIREDDLASGRWDGAQLSVFAVDWTATVSAPVPLIAGELGMVEIKGDRFSVELRGATSVLDAPVVEETSPECRASLGDRRCCVDMAGRVHRGAIVSVADAQVTLADPIPGGVLASGRLRWLDGENAGLASIILQHSNAVITLSDPPHFPVVAGTRVEVSEGCDRRFATCAQRFSNAVNFRGEPHLPGNDLLMRYAV
jgi:uncharacterized phage protein (TIGR02218 family)